MTRCGGSASSTASSWSRSCPPSSSGATATSSSTRSGPARTASWCSGFHAPGRWNDIVAMTDCMLASERGNVLREQVLAFCRAQGLSAWDRRDQQGFLRNLVVREGRRTGATQVRLITSPGKLDVDAFIAAVDTDGLLWTETADLGESTTGGETRRWPARRSCPRSSRGLDFLISPEAFFQTNTEMAEQLYAVAREYAGAARARARLRPLLRDRHDRPVARFARPRGHRRRDHRAGRLRRDRQRAHQRDRERALLRRRHPRDHARAGRARRQARPGDHRPAARRPVGQDRPPDRRGRAEPDRLRLLQPDDARAERGPARRGRLPADQGPPGRHVPADAAHRSRRPARGRPGRRPATPRPTSPRRRTAARCGRRSGAGSSPTGGRSAASVVSTVSRGGWTATHFPFASRRIVTLSGGGSPASWRPAGSRLGM